MRHLVISDIHSNLEAFQTVLDDAGSVDQIWCLGDVVGYGPDPNECVELLRSLPHLCIAGNHDWATVGRLDLDDFNKDARLANLQNREQLAPHNLAYLNSLPETLVVGEFTLVHGSPRHPIWEYMMDGRTALDNLSHFDTPFCFVGHTHVPAVYGLDSANGQVQELALPSVAQLAMGFDRLIINPGSVGQPRDGDPRASYLVLDIGENSLQHGRVDYPFQRTQKKMVELGLPARLATRLRHGW